MRLEFARRSVVVLVMIPLIGTQAFSQSPAAKDSSALTVLAQMAAASGWTALSIPKDAVATGTITANTPTGTQSYPVVFKARPGNQFRTEFPTRGSVIVVNGQQGSHISPAGTETVQAFASYSMRPLMFGFFTILAQFGALDIGLADLGSEPSGADTLRRIELKQLASLGDGLDAPRLLGSRMVVFVSQATGMPVKIEHNVISSANPTAFLAVTDNLSDFRRVGSLIIPFHMEEFADGQRLWSLQLDSVQVNTGLADSDFDVK